MLHPLIVLHDVSAAFDTSALGYRGVQPDFAHHNRVPRAPARCTADLVPLAVAQSSMARPAACGDALWAQEKEVSYPCKSRRVGASTHSFTRIRNVTASLPSTTRWS